MAMPDPWEKHRLDEIPEEKVVLHAYVDGAWTTRDALAKLSGPEPFDRGAMRCCFRMKLHDTHRSPDGKIHAPMWARAPNFVAKRYLPVDAKSISARRAEPGTAMAQLATARRLSAPPAFDAATRAHVEAQFYGGDDWYPAVIKRRLPDGRVEIVADEDGDVDTVPLAAVRAPSSDGGASDASASASAPPPAATEGAKLVDVPPSAYYEDVLLQATAAAYAAAFDKQNPPKPIEVIEAQVMECVERDGAPVYVIERFIEGEYVKVCDSVYFLLLYYYDDYY